jgi:hypothetical protein
MSNQILQLSVRQSDVDLGPFSPTKDVAANWPTHHNIKVGTVQKQVPITYLDKHVIEEGQYVDPKTGNTVKATRKQIQEWARKLNDMVALGVIEPSVPCDHSKKSADNLGTVKRAKTEEVNGKLRLSLTHALVGEDAPIIALRNRASIGIDPDYTDGKGKSWGSTIVHSSITPDPVVTGMGTFTPAQLSRRQVEPQLFFLSRTMETTHMPGKLKPEHKKVLCKMLGMDESTASDEDLMSRCPDEGLRDEMHKQSLDLHAVHAHTAQLSRTLEEKDAELAQAKEQMVTLSRADAEDVPDENTLTLLARSAKTDREAVIREGGVDEATMKKIDGIFTTNGKLNTLALSRSSGNADPLLFELYAALRGNKPRNGFTEKSGIQQLARTLPNTSGSDDESKKKVRDRMARVATAGLKTANV